MVKPSLETIPCIYCGFQNVEKIQLRKSTYKYPKTLSARVMGTGIGYAGSHGTASDMFYETYVCRNCNKTEAEGSMAPAIVKLTDNNNHRIDILLPESLLKFFSSIRMEEGEIVESIKGVERRLKQILKDFEMKGVNPCKKGNRGYKAKLLIKRNKVHVYLMVENNGAGRCVRVVYDGGWSFCE